MEKTQQSIYYNDLVEQEFCELWETMYNQLKLVVWDCSLYNTPKHRYIVLDCIKVSEEARKQGVASMSMKLLCEYADKYNLRVYLQPSDIYGTSIEILEKFYSKFQFKRSFKKDIPLEYKTYHLREPKT